MTHVAECITAQDLEQYAIKKDERILFKTRNSERAATDLFDARFVYVAQDAAHMLATIGIACVGIDYLGIERNQPAHETHTALLLSTIAIIEGLRLKEVVAGNYQLCCLPLNIPGVDGAPARAVLLTKE
jgi:arylformamidase